MKLALYALGRVTRKKGKCPRGKILRKAYTRKDGTRVKASCILDRGKPGKGPKTLPKPKKGGLRGWKTDMAPDARRRILSKISKEEGCATAIRRLTLLQNITDDMPTKKAAISDKKWLHAHPKICFLKSEDR